MEWNLEESWCEKLKDEMDKPYYRELVDKVQEEYENETCYPPEDKIFNALNLCPFDKVKVVIMGQDPYFNPGQAMGLSFSVPEGLQLAHHCIISIRRLQLTWVQRFISRAT